MTRKRKVWIGVGVLFAWGTLSNAMKDETPKVPEAAKAAVVTTTAPSTAPPGTPPSTERKRPATTTTTVRATTTTMLGQPAVYERIAAETDCSELQREFDTAAETSDRGGQWRKLGIAYMEAADARMQEVGCY